jgi:ABC-type lipoprotein release transport system permease subunit
LAQAACFLAPFRRNQLLRRFLFETSPADPLTYVLVLVLFGLLAVLAAWRPAHRASRVEPMQVLRSE